MIQSFNKTNLKEINTALSTLKKQIEKENAASIFDEMETNRNKLSLFKLLNNVQLNKFKIESTRGGAQQSFQGEQGEAGLAFDT